jgi:hypothetical protein
VPVVRELEDAKIQDRITAVHPLIHDQVSVEDATYKTGQNQANISTVMIVFSKINARMHTVGNLTIFQVLINA